MIMPRNWLCKGYFGCHYFPSEATVVLYLKVIFFISAFEFSECFILTFVLLCSLCWWDFRDGKNGSLEDQVIQGEGPRASCYNVDGRMSSVHESSFIFFFPLKTLKSFLLRNCTQNDEWISKRISMNKWKYFENMLTMQWFSTWATTPHIISL